MDNNFNSFNPVSGADSASVQEQLVKGSLSSSNFNNASKREQSSSLELPSVSIFGSANIVDELEEVDLDFHKYDYRSGHPAVFCCTYHKYNERRPLAGMSLDQCLQQQSHQFDARQVHGFSQMLLHNRKKFANFALVLGISSFLHLKNRKFFFTKLLISKDLCNS